MYGNPSSPIRPVSPTLGSDSFLPTSQSFSAVPSFRVLPPPYNGFCMFCIWTVCTLRFAVTFAKYLPLKPGSLPQNSDCVICTACATFNSFTNPKTLSMSHLVIYILLIIFFFKYTFPNHETLQ